MLTKREIQYMELLPNDKKMELYDECDFTLNNNHKALQYISDRRGPGTEFLRLMFGTKEKAKGQILKNTVKLQDKMRDILNYLDKEVRNDRLHVMHISDGLMNLYYCSLHITYLLEDFANRIKIIDDFLAEKYPNYQDKWDDTVARTALDMIKAEINAHIDTINADNEQYYQSFINAQGKIERAKANRILRITPYEATVITKNGVAERTPIKFENKFALVVRPKTISKWIGISSCSIAVLPEFMYKFHTSQPKGKKPEGITLMTPADYFMYLWFANTSPKKRKGCCVCMLDIYSSTLYAYGYKVSEDGSSYCKLFFADENHLPSGFHQNDVCKWLKKLLGERYDDTLFFRTFVETTDKPLLKRLDDVKVFKKPINAVDPAWENIMGKNDGEGLAMFIHNNFEPIFQNKLPVITNVLM